MCHEMEGPHRLRNGGYDTRPRLGRLGITGETREHDIDWFVDEVSRCIAEERRCVEIHVCHRIAAVDHDDGIWKRFSECLESLATCGVSDRHGAVVPRPSRMAITTASSFE